MTARRPGMPTRIPVHRAVALAYIGPPPTPDHIVCHTDGNYQNNTVGNLSWGTHESNAQDRKRHGTTLAGASHYRAKLTESDVLAIRAEHGKSYAELAKQFGVSKSTIAWIIQRRSWKEVQE